MLKQIIAVAAVVLGCSAWFSGFAHADSEFTALNKDVAKVMNPNGCVSAGTWYPTTFKELAVAAGAPNAELCIVRDMPFVSLALLDGTVIVDLEFITSKSSNAVKFLFAHELSHVRFGDSAARVRFIRETSGKPLDTLAELENAVTHMPLAALQKYSELAIKQEYAADKVAYVLTGVPLDVVREIISEEDSSITHPSGTQRFAALANFAR